MSKPIHRRLRTPTEDGAALIDPPLTEVTRLIERNRQIAVQFDQQSGLPANCRMMARVFLAMQAALADGVNRSNEQLAADAKRPVILTGHQPELFHPGVWFKNFLASTIARQAAGYAINLVIDNDTIRSAAIRVPTIGPSGPQVVEVPLDAPSAAIPWEERRILDSTLFQSFGSEVHRAFDSVANRRVGQRIILDDVWPQVIEAMELRNRHGREVAARFANERNLKLPHDDFQVARLEDCLTAARSRVEREIGLTIADYPLKACSEHPPFLAFARLLFQRHREFHDIYNAALAEYRHVNHVRSQSHPVPELAADGDWLETPFWIWTVRNPHRRRAFLKVAAGTFELSDRNEASFSVPSDDWPAFRKAMLTSRIKLRPRALITTMFARLILSDLFIHGIGGAKYDELTDLIIRRFFGIEPPAFMTATATFRLPIERPDVTLHDVRQAAQRIRETRYRPEAFLTDQRVRQDSELSQKFAALAAEKREFLDKHDLRRCPQHVFDQLDRLNRAMHELLQPVEAELRAKQAELVALAKQSQLLGSREFSFVLFPADTLPTRLLDLCNGSS